MAGRVYEGYAEAEDALDGAWHPNCVHWVERVGGETSLESPRLGEWLNNLLRRAPSPLPPAAAASVREAEDGIRTLPHEVGVAFDGSGRETVRRIGDIDRVEFTPDERRAMRGGTLTHNHPDHTMYPVGDPRRDGESFSLADVLFAAQENLAEVRVVTGRYRYTMRPGGGRWPSRAQVLRAYERADAVVLQRVANDSRSGTLDHVASQADYFHDLWTEAARELGLVYSREEG